MQKKYIGDYIKSLTQDAPDSILGEKAGKSVKSIQAIQLLAKTTLNANIATDQVITLLGGTKFIVTDCFLYNVSINLNVADNFNIYSSSLQGGIRYYNANNAGLASIDLNHYLDKTDRNVIYSFSSKIISNTMYASFATPQGSSAAIDLFIYGHVIG